MLFENMCVIEAAKARYNQGLEPNMFFYKDSAKEIDLISSRGANLIPIEIKSGKEGKLKSLHQFIDEAPHPYAVRLYAGKFSIEQHQTPKNKSYFLMNLPYYLATKLNAYLEFLVSNYSLTGH
jgi:hypothetical protein